MKQTRSVETPAEKDRKGLRSWSQLKKKQKKELLLANKENDFEGSFYNMAQNEVP